MGAVFSDCILLLKDNGVFFPEGMVDPDDGLLLLEAVDVGVNGLIFPSFIAFISRFSSL